MSESVTKEWLTEQILEMNPWHHNIQIRDDFSVSMAFGDETKLARSENDGVSLIDTGAKFRERMTSLYPDGMAGRRFLDCACNGGIYCFLARELGADYVYGFDIRDHWIKQAKFIQEHRVVAPTDKIDFQIHDLYQLPEQNLEPFDFTYFSGIFYHLPDPIHGLKIACELTKEIIVVNTASIYDPDNAGGLTPRRRTSSEHVMSGVSELAWFPNGPKAILLILNWLGFKEFKLTQFMQGEDRHRFEIYGSREPGRLADLKGNQMKVRDIDFS